MKTEEYKAILKTRPLSNLHVAAKRARDQLELNNAFEEMEDDFDGPFPPTKAYETFKSTVSEKERHDLLVCLSLIEAEIKSRGTTL